MFETLCIVLCLCNFCFSFEAGWIFTFCCLVWLHTCDPGAWAWCWDYGCVPPFWFSKFLLWKGEQGLYFLKAGRRGLYFNVASFYVINLGKTSWERKRERASKRESVRQMLTDSGLEPGGTLWNLATCSATGARLLGPKHTNFLDYYNTYLFKTKQNQK